MKMNENNERSLKHFIYQMKGTQEKEWHYLAHSRIQYTNKTTTEKVYSFKECYELIEQGKEDFDFYPVYTSKTLFTKKPTICFYDAFNSAYTEQKMGSEVVMRIKAIDESNATMQELMNQMYQEDFIAYLKDRNLQCPFFEQR